MKKQIKITSLEHIRSITIAATEFYDDIQVMDSFGKTANAKSILGLMGLDYSSPVVLYSENTTAAEYVYAAYEGATAKTAS
ncbi:MAG: HPr family phosphocarrier protein [Oscillospiraceae bacterium]